ncbi:MAG: hypothetical protein ACXADY_04195 [Candidatus Hodarchaeales archaeon]|jgi:hypothetical protein
MIVDRKKFPFKWMWSIIETLERCDFLSSLEIARAIGSCVPDADEVTNMIHYITYFGKVKSDMEGKWRIFGKEEDSNPPQKDFRFRYIRILMEIIDILDEGTLGNVELAQKTSQKIDDIQEAMSFLALITEKGSIHLQEKDSSQNWSLKPWV